ncbi:putative actin-related protein 2/3 complex subunit 3 [Baffinella frigidus]|nr:putative actin-related protein 2/3 complex subunit 3 [Cryptophyta sp. CCMP2293]|mmetsp:Transcript_65215/g.155765  ORF Transcript_65215/g.155765 Transcript_65215/m.155765 type:complete len:179 (+) Transcript_65215:97-633(+)|eukprot:CAMPEP_0180134000 /NCGR_PEP_ID=MMETSP0986-20121125/9876_1 /TAXON_ID=697907 /ORGANISM="non described non described, Strain CCMP2293" /LENGTH=178 /DNA_ID=CAMNT_0022074227 /DNA_START=95 /DNA_END=631 /DNA_ORIENTATION=+
MARHSSYNETEAKIVCGASMLPFRTACKGPVNSAKVGAFEGDGEDVIDEAVKFYRANVLFRNYELQGGADRIIIYLTLYVSACLAKIEKCASPKDAEKALQTMAMEAFALPGQHGFPFNGFFDKPEAPAEGDDFKAYFRQLREETGLRVIKVAFTPQGKPNKFWVCFAKRKFMNTVLA